MNIKIFFLSLLLFQVSQIFGMQLLDMPMDIVQSIVRHAMWLDVNHTDNDQKPKMSMSCHTMRSTDVHAVWTNDLIEKMECANNHNDLWHTIRRNHALQRVSKAFQRIFWRSFNSPEFTLQEKDKVISFLLRMWNQGDYHTRYLNVHSVPQIADMAVGMQASLFPVLYASIFVGNPKFVRSLVDSGDTKVINQQCYSRTPLCLAVLYRRLEIVQLLLTHPDIEVNESFPLYWAAQCEQVDMVKLLLAHPKIQVNAVNKNGETVLFVVVGSRFSDILLRPLVDLLINAGVDSTIKNNEGKTVLDIARKCKQTNIIESLEQALASKKDNL